MQNTLSKTVRTFAAYLAVMFVVYCSVGVCSQMLASVQSPPAVADSAHAHHQMSKLSQHDSQGVSHCAESNSCEWSLNPLSDGALTLDDSIFFFAYLVAAAALIMQLSTVTSGGWRNYAFSRERFYQYTYPRLHLQQAVFLN